MQSRKNASPCATGLFSHSRTGSLEMELSHLGTALIEQPIKTVSDRFFFCSAARACNSCNGKADTPVSAALRPPFAIFCRTFLGHSSMLLKRGLADINASSLGFVAVSDHCKNTSEAPDTLTILAAIAPPVQDSASRKCHFLFFQHIYHSFLQKFWILPSQKRFFRILPSVL